MSVAIVLEAVNFTTAEMVDPDGNRLVMAIFTDPQSGINVRIPMPDEAARKLAAMLEGRSAVIVPANRMPRMDIPGMKPRHAA